MFHLFLERTELPSWRKNRLISAFELIKDANTRESLQELLRTPGWENTKFGSKYRPIYPECARLLMSIGYTNVMLAGAFEVSVETLAKWRVKYPDFERAMRLGEAAREAIKRLIIALRLSNERDGKQLIENFISEHEAGKFDDPFGPELKISFNDAMQQYSDEPLELRSW